MLRNDVTEALKQELWARFGSENYPAEWDGKLYGGGKLSQRYWEYFKALDLLNLDRDSVVLDIGGGSPVTGLGFFSSLMATAVKRVIVMDPNVSEKHPLPPNVEIIRTYSNFDTLTEAFRTFPDLTHLASISVLEHIPADIRSGIMRAINESFPGDRLVMTLEYHAVHCFFEHQLTARTLSEMLLPLTAFYPTDFEASPVFGEGALIPLHSRTRLRAFVKSSVRRLVGYVPKWYPLALGYQRAKPR